MKTARSLCWLALWSCTYPPFVDFINFVAEVMLLSCFQLCRSTDCQLLITSINTWSAVWKTNFKASWGSGMYSFEWILIIPPISWSRKLLALCSHFPFWIAYLLCPYRLNSVRHSSALFVEESGGKLETISIFKKKLIRARRCLSTFIFKRKKQA